MDYALKEELLILICGKYEALLVNNEDKELVIIEEHYSNGSLFKLDKVNGLYYLKYENSYLSYRDNVISIRKSYSDFDSLLIADPINDIFFTLKCMDGYFDQYLELCEYSESIILQWTSGNAFLGDDLNESLKTYVPSDLTNSYISVDGLNLVNSEKLFNMVVEGDIYCNALQLPDLAFQDDIFYTGVAVKFIKISDIIYIKCENNKYLGFEENYTSTLIPKFIDELPGLPITLIKTDENGVYLLGNNNQFLSVVPINSFSITETTNNRGDASKFQFIFYNSFFVNDEDELESESD